MVVVGDEGLGLDGLPVCDVDSAVLTSPCITCDVTGSGGAREEGLGRGVPMVELGSVRTCDVGGENSPATEEEGSVNTCDVTGANVGPSDDVGGEKRSEVTPVTRSGGPNEDLVWGLNVLVVVVVVVATPGVVDWPMTSLVGIPVGLSFVTNALVGGALLDFVLAAVSGVVVVVVLVVVVVDGVGAGVVVVVGFLVGAGVGGVRVPGGVGFAVEGGAGLGVLPSRLKGHPPSPSSTSGRREILISNNGKGKVEYGFI